MVTVCVGGGRRTICNGFPLPTKCTMIKLFPFFSFGYFDIFQESWCLSLNMAILLSLPANKMHNDRLVSFFFSLGCFFVICCNFGVYHQIWHYFFISRQALYSGFILSSLLFSVIVPVNQAPINILSFPRLVSLLTKQSSSYFFFLILFFYFFYYSRQPTTNQYPLSFLLSPLTK